MKFSIFLIYISFLSCSFKSKKVDVNCEAIFNKSYSDAIFEIKSRVVDLTYLRQPLMFKEYQPIYDNPECYVSDVYKFIKVNSHDSIAVQIALLSLYKLNSQSTVKFTKKIYPIIDDEEIFVMWLGGAYGNETFLNFDSSTEAYLKQLQKKNNTSEYVKMAIEDLLSGQVGPYE